MIHLTKVERSSQVTGLGHDPVSGTLAVLFNSGMYHYFDVPPEKAAEAHAVAADPEQSLGRWLNANIKGKFRHERQGDEPTEVTTTDGKTVDFKEPWQLPAGA